MNSKSLTPWVAKSPVKISKENRTPKRIIDFAVQLSDRDKTQLVSGFESQSYEMVSGFVWMRASRSLMNVLSKLGMEFISDLLNRPDIASASNLDKVISDFDAIRLAKDLGVIGAHEAFRLTQAMDLVHHFNSSSAESEDEPEMMEHDALSVLHACVESILGHRQIEGAINFAKFRENIESQSYSGEEKDIETLLKSPYFFHRAAVRMLITSVKNSRGAQLDNSLANFNVLLPLLWDLVRKPERYQVGQTYSELVSDGKKQAASGIKSALLKVKGFDYVPEDLRSNAFLKVASEILTAHDNFNNFHNESAPMKLLSSMGSTIPIPAFPLCMTATMCVKLGNRYGYSWEAESYADAVLDALPEHKWKYFLDECLPTDDRVLYELRNEAVQDRLKTLSQKYQFAKIGMENALVKKLVLGLDSTFKHEFHNSLNKLLAAVGVDSESSK